MRVRQKGEASKQFEALLEACEHDGPQMVMKHGKEVAVLVPIGQWKRLQKVGQPSGRHIRALSHNFA